MANSAVTPYSAIDDIAIPIANVISNLWKWYDNKGTSEVGDLNSIQNLVSAGNEVAKSIDKILTDTGLKGKTPLTLAVTDGLSSMAACVSFQDKVTKLGTAVNRKDNHALSVAIVEFIGAVAGLISVTPGLEEVPGLKAAAKLVKTVADFTGEGIKNPEVWNAIVNFMGTLSTDEPIYVNALSISTTLRLVAPSLQDSTLQDILKACAASGDAKEFEAFVTAMHNLFGGEFRPTDTLAGKLSIALNQYVHDYGRSVPLSFVDLSQLSVADIVYRATNDVAYTYALVNLNPFAITDRGEIYANANKNGDFSLYDSATGKGLLTTQYLQDRAALLSLIMQQNIAGSIYNPKYPHSDVYYQYDQPGYKVQPIQVGAIPDPSAEHIEFGANGSHLYGGTSVNHFYAGAGTETLEGGTGNSSYFIEANQAGVRDTIIDSSGQGSIYVGSTQLGTLGTAQFTGVDTMTGTPAYVWASADGTMVYSFQPKNWNSSDNTGTLTITCPAGGLLLAAGEQIAIRNFNLAEAQSSAGYLGIHLSEHISLSVGTQADYGAGAISANAPAGNRLTGNICLGTTSEVDRTVSLLLRSGDASHLEVYVDGTMLKFANGSEIQFVVPAGQNQVTFSMVDWSNSQTPDTLKFAAIYKDGNSVTVPSNSLTVTFNPGVATIVPGIADYTYNGDYNPLLSTDEVAVGHAIDPKWQILSSQVGQTHVDAQGSTVVDSYIYKHYTLDQAGNYVTDTGQYDPNRSENLKGASGNDSIIAGSGNDIIDVTQGGNDTIISGDGTNSIQAGDGSDTITLGNGQNTIVAGKGANDIHVGSGQNVITVGDGGNQIFANNITDLASAITHRQTVATNSQQSGNTIYAGNGDNTIAGGSGNDYIRTGTGNNEIVLGAGNNIVFSGAPALQTAGYEWEWNTSMERYILGFPYLSYIKGPDLGSQIDVVDGDAYDPADGFAVAGGVSADYRGVMVDGLLVGADPTTAVPVGGGNNTIYGGAGDSVYWLSNGNNWLAAGGGNDHIFTGTGSNTIYGGIGNDTIYGAGNGSYINLESGSDQVSVYGNNNTIIGGSGDNSITSRGNGNYLFSGTGNSTIYGGNGSGSGSDTLISGSQAGTGKSTTIVVGGGNAYIVGGNGNDVIKGGSGSDTIYAGDGNAVIYTGDGGTVAGPTMVYGGNGSDIIYGGAGVAQISAGDGGTAANATQVYAGSGTSTISGGAGVDQLYGGAGSDTLIAGTGTSTLQGGSGTEVMYSSIGNATLIAGTGSDTLYGGSGNDVLQGNSAGGTTLFVAGTGSETIIGGSGASTYQFNPGFGNVELKNAHSSDTFELGCGINPTDITVGATMGSDGNVALLLQNANGGQVTIDGGLDGAISSFVFLDPVTLTFDQLMANQSINVAEANGNIMLSTLGHDTLVGGQGNDTIYAWNGGNTMVAGAGNQILKSKSGNDTLIGGGGNDTLVSAAGSDVLIGGTGNTTFVVNGTTDIVHAVSTGSNVNTVDSSVSYVLPENVQNLTLTGTANLTAIGNDMSNVITANSGNDLLMGGAASSTLIGGSGADTLMAGAGGGTLIAGSGNDVLMGGAGATTMVGGSGFDTMIAGTGGGTIVAGTGWDTIVLNQGSGKQTIVESATMPSGTIQFGAGITAGNSQFFLNGTDLLINYGTKGDSVLIKGFAPNGSTGSQTINLFQFSDGTQASYVNDGQGNVSVMAYGDTSKSDFWQKPDGSYGNDSYYYAGGTHSTGSAHNADGTYSTYYDDGKGNVTTKCFDANGSLQNYTRLVGDGHGNGTTTTYDAVGKMLGYSVSTNDGLGNTSVKTYGPTGKLLSDSFANADGSHSADTFNADGSSIGSSYAADGSGYTYTQDASGKNYLEQDYGPGGVFTGTYSNTIDGMAGGISVTRGVNGAKTFDNWDHTNLDGTWGTDTFNADGSSSGTTNRTNPDGTFAGTTQYTNDGKGNITTNNYDANGVLLSYSVFAGDVLGNGTATNYDAVGGITGTSVSVNDGMGNSSTTSYDVGGIKLSDNWTKSDGTSGSDTFNADGSYSSVVNDGHGNVATTNRDTAGNVVGSSVLSYDGQSTYTTTTFDANGIRLCDSWRRTDDGSHGSDTFNADGSSFGTAYSTYGTTCNYSTYANDGLGNVTTNFYDPSGVPLGHSVLASDGHGNTTTTNYDAGGNVVGSCISVNDGAGDTSVVNYNGTGAKLSDSWNKADGSHGTDTFNTDGSTSGIAYNPDGRHSTYFNDGFGNVATTNYGLNGAKLSDVWAKADGTHGSDTFNADGASSVIAYNADGSCSVKTNDALGNGSIASFDVNGVKLSDSWTKVDGANGTDSFNADGSSSGSVNNADGSHSTYTSDGHGNSTTTNYGVIWNMLGSTVTKNDGLGNLSTKTYDANGTLLSDSFTNADGSHGSDTFSASGISSGSYCNPDGTYYTYIRDAQGNYAKQDYNANNVKAGDYLSHLDGSWSQNFYNADGSSGGTAHSANGNYINYTDDGHGNGAVTNFNAQGAKLSDSWNKADGSHGTDIFNADGSSSGTNYSADRSHSSYANDGLGGVTTTYFDAAGTKLSDAWTRAGGSFGTDTFNADGSSTSFVNDGLGNATTTNYDASGVVTSDIWSKADGSHGADTFNADGSSVSTSYAADGSYSTYSNDGHGNATTNRYDASGVLRSYTTLVSDGNGNGTTTNYDALGNVLDYSVSTNDGLGNTSLTNYNASNVKLSDSWVKADGTSGSDTFNADGSSVGVVNDGYGLTTTTNYDANNVKLSDTWSRLDRSHGADAFNADGSSSGTSYAANGSYSTYSNDGKGDLTTYNFDANGVELGYTVTTNNSGGATTTNYNALTGETTGSVATAGAGYSYTYDKTQNIGGVVGVTESKVSYTYADGSTYATDTVYDPNGSYQQSTLKGDGSTTTTNYNAANGEVTGSVATAGAGYSYTYDNTQNVGGVAGVTESKVNYTYADGSTYNTDTVYDPNGSYQQSTLKGDGSTTTTNYNAANGEVTGSVATAGAGYSYTYDNTVNVNGVAGETESKVAYTYADGSTYATDTVYDPNGSYQQSTLKGDGRTTTTNYNAANGEVTGSVATAGAGYSYTYDNTVNVNGVAGETESKVAYTYANGSTYATDTVYDPNGSYQQSTLKGDGSTTTTNYNAANGEVTGSVATAGAGYSYTYDNTVNVNGVAGETESKVAYTYADGSTYATDTVYDPNGSYQQSTLKGDGSTTTTNYNAANGEVTGSVATAGAGYSYTYDNTQNVGGVAGVTESKVNYTYADGSTYATDTVYDPNGSYQQSTLKGDGSTTTTNYNAVNGEVTGSVATAGAGYSYTYDNTVNVGGVSGVTESKVNYTYVDGSTYATDTVYDPNGSYQQSTLKGDGSSTTTNYNAANGEVTGSVATAGAGYSYTYDNTQNVGGVAGVTESKVAYTYADGSTYGTDTVYNPDGSYFQAWNKSDGTAGSSAVSGGVLTGDSWVHADGSQGVDAGANHLIMGGAASDAITAAGGNDILIGGAGNDVITTGSGTDIIAFNKGDGQDVVNAVAGQNNVLSLGGNFAYNDLALARNGNDLVLDIGATDSITFQGWYAGNNNIVDLQVIASAMSDFTPGSADVLRNMNVENFDFQSLVAQFDAAQAANPGITTWGVTNALLTAHLSGSDTAAMGGDLAYDYGARGALSGMNVAAAESTLSSNQFATAQQSLNPWPTLNTGTAQIK